MKEKPQIEIALQPKQSELYRLIEETEYTWIAFGGANGSGKALSLNTQIPTPNGFVELRDVSVGDYVFQPNGDKTRVVWESGFFTPKELFEIEFSSGEKVKADGGHLWKVQTFHHRRSQERSNTNKSITLTTKEMYLTQRIKGKVNYSIPNASNIKYSHKKLPIDPYTLGLWLGDGASQGGMLYFKDIEFNELFKHIHEKITNKMVDYVNEKEGFVFTKYRVENLTTRLRELNLLHNKHIPELYLKSSIKQRKELIRGVMDSDGYASRGGKIEIVLSNKKLITDVHTLLSSLGIKCNILSKDLSHIKESYKTAYRINFIANFPIFHLKRKLDRVKYAINNVSKNRYIVCIKKIKPELVKCIQVAESDGMFLITKSYIPTHNSQAIRDVNALLCAKKRKLTIKTLIFRRNSNDLLENHINPFFQQYPLLRSLFNKTERIIYWSNGNTTKFGSADREEDITNFEGKEYDYIFVDEATLSTQYMIEFLRTRNRSGIVLAKMILTMIPGFISTNFIRRLFITKQYEAHEDPSAYVFLPARVWDNAVWVEDQLEQDNLTVEDFYSWDEEKRMEYTLLYSDYAKNLSHLPEMKRRARLYGDWFVIEGAFFDFYSEVHVVKSSNYLSYKDIKSTMAVVGSLDYGNVTVLTLVARTKDNNYILFDELYFEKMSRTEKIKKTKEFLAKRGFSKTIIVGDTNMWLNDGFDVDITSTAALEYIRAGIKLIKVAKTSPERNRGYRFATNDLVQNLLHYKIEDGTNNLVKKPRLLVYERCTEFIRTFPILVVDKNNPEDIAPNQEDHCFVAGTQIATNKGYRNIEDIKVGDRVLTRFGYRKVTKTHKRRLQKVRHYKELGLTNTPSHPAITEKGEKNICELTNTDNLFRLKRRFYIHENRCELKKFHIMADKIIGYQRKDATVYNLSVYQHNEYFANDILVHNCYDSAKYGIMYLRPKKVKKEDNTPLFLRNLRKKKKTKGFMGV